jgi:hypothetical protein
VPVQVVFGQVEQDGGVGREGLGVLELERGGLADHDRLALDRARQRRQRRPHVARHDDGQPGLAVDVPDQLDRRGLAVRAGHGHEVVRQQPPADLELPDHPCAAPEGRRHDRRLSRHAGALDHGRRRIEQADALGRRVHGHPGGRELRAHVVADRSGVASGHLRAPRAQRQRRGDAGAGEADDEERAGRQRGAFDHDGH